MRDPRPRPRHRPAEDGRAVLAGGAARARGAAVSQIIDAIKSTLDKTPPELAVRHHGPRHHARRRRRAAAPPGRADPPRDRDARAHRRVAADVRRGRLRAARSRSSTSSTSRPARTPSAAAASTGRPASEPARCMSMHEDRYTHAGDGDGDDLHRGDRGRLRLRRTRAAAAAGRAPGASPRRCCRRAPSPTTTSTSGASPACDIVFLCLPHGASREIRHALAAAGTPRRRPRLRLPRRMAGCTACRSCSARRSPVRASSPTPAATRRRRSSRSRRSSEAGLIDGPPVDRRQVRRLRRRHGAVGEDAPARRCTAASALQPDRPPPRRRDRAGPLEIRRAAPRHVHAAPAAALARPRDHRLRAADASRCAGRRRALYRDAYAGEPFVRLTRSRTRRLLQGSNAVDRRRLGRRPADEHRDRRRRARQPRQGRRRPGDAEREPDARPRRGRRADRAKGCGRRRHLPARLPGGGRRPAGSRSRAGPTSRSSCSDGPASAAGVFTQNRVVAAPVALCRERSWRAERARAGGQQRQRERLHGRAGAMPTRTRMASLSASCTRLRADEVLVCSTGVIGVPLPMDRVEAGIRAAAAALSAEGGEDAAVAICTTDSHPKLARRPSRVAGREVRLGGMAKGAGMIRPDLGDDDRGRHDRCRDRRRPASSRCSARGARRSFNRITVDGSQSTSDSVIVLASGASGVTIDRGPDGDGVRRGAARRLPRPRARDRVGRRGRPPDRPVRGGRRPLYGRCRPRRAATSPRTSSCAARCTAPTRTGAGCVAALGVVRRRPRHRPDAHRSGRGAAGARRDRGAGAADGGRRGCAGAPQVDVRIDLAAGRGSRRSSTGSDLSTEYVLNNSEYTT